MLLCREGFFFSVFSVAKKRLNTKATEAVRALRVETLEAQRIQRGRAAIVPVTDPVRILRPPEEFVNPQMFGAGQLGVVMK
jgi:hypothetical protein